MAIRYLKKIDAWLFKSVTAVVKGWIKKKKYQQHKFDFAILVKGWEAAWWLGVVFWQAAQLFLGHRVAASMITMGLLVLVAFFESGSFFMARKQKQKHDRLFALRKNPDVYAMEKAVLEMVNEATQRTRIFSLTMVLALAAIIVWANPLLLPVYAASTLQLYIPMVFDFEDPEKKDKKQKDTLTEIAQAAWRHLVGSLKPQGL